MYELDTPKKVHIFNQILLENGISNDDGNLYLDAASGKLFQSYMRFTHAVSKIVNMQIYRRDVVKNLFYEDLETIMTGTLQRWTIQKTYIPDHLHQPTTTARKTALRSPNRKWNKAARIVELESVLSIHEQDA